jgi:hypothetical protein
MKKGAVYMSVDAFSRGRHNPDLHRVRLRSMIALRALTKSNLKTSFSIP